LCARRGKFAVVKKCVEKTTGKEHAAKFLRKRRKGQDCRSDILNEIAVLESAETSPYVVINNYFSIGVVRHIIAVM